MGTETELMADYMVRAVEGMVIAFLLYLGMGINDAEYMMVCGRCHRWCYSYGAVRTRKSVMVRQETGYVLMKENVDDSTGIAMAEPRRKTVRFGHNN